MMEQVKLSAAGWLCRDDFYDAILPALGAPEWHGRNLDALRDTINGDDINQVKLPIRFEITDRKDANENVLEMIADFKELVEFLRDHDGCDVGLEISD